MTTPSLHEPLPLDGVGPLVDHRGRGVDLASLVKPSRLATAWGHPGPPLVLLLGRGWFCPRDQAHLRHVVGGWDRLALTGASFAYVAVQAWEEQAAFRAGLGAGFAFLSDADRALATAWDLVDATEGEQSDVILPVVLLCDHDLVVRQVWDGWWLDGRPTVDELLLALRELRADRADGGYEGWTDERVTALRVPAKVWEDDLDPPGVVTERDVPGRVAAWDRAAGIGTITLDDGREATVHFTAVPGHGDRGIDVGEDILADVLDHPADGTWLTNLRTR